MEHTKPDEFVLAEGIPYRIINKWHQERSKPAFLDADSDNAHGLIYRSNSLSDNTIWFLAKESDGAYNLLNKWHLDRNLPHFLNATSGEQPKLVNRSTLKGDNSAWYIIPTGNGSFRIQSKYFRGKEQDLLDADSDEPSGRIYISGSITSDNVCWYFQPVNSKPSAVNDTTGLLTVLEKQYEELNKKYWEQEKRIQALSDKGLFLDDKLYPHPHHNHFLKLHILGASYGILDVTDKVIELVKGQNSVTIKAENEVFGNNGGLDGILKILSITYKIGDGPVKVVTAKEHESLTIKSSIEVYGATYGPADVTDKVRSLISSGNRKILAANTTFGDSWVGTYKTLTVVYSDGTGKIKVAAAGETHELTL